MGHSQRGVVRLVVNHAASHSCRATLAITPISIRVPTVLCYSMHGNGNRLLIYDIDKCGKVAAVQKRNEKGMSHV